MPSLVLRLLKPFLYLCRNAIQTLDGANSGQAGSSTKIEHCPMFSLPNELLLIIATQMDQPSRVLLSLTCRRMYRLLHSDFGLHIDTLMQRVEFLHLLERDHPEYLTCCVCGWMFLWQNQRSSYFCPLVSKHSALDHIFSSTFKQENDEFHNQFITIGLIDLIFRAHKNGPSHGLPVSVLNTTPESARPGLYHDAINRFNEARMVSGQLILHKSLQVTISSRNEALRRLDTFYLALCRHFHINKTILMAKAPHWEIIAQALPEPLSPQEIPIFKCTYCMTDAILSVAELTDLQWRITLKVWCSYSDPRHAQRQPFHEQIFRLYPTISQSHDEISQRNLKELFES